MGRSMKWIWKFARKIPNRAMKREINRNCFINTFGLFLPSECELHWDARAMYNRQGLHLNWISVKKQWDDVSDTIDWGWKWELCMHQYSRHIVSCYASFTYCTVVTENLCKKALGTLHGQWHAHHVTTAFWVNFSACLHIWHSINEYSVYV